MIEFGFIYLIEEFLLKYVIKQLVSTLTKTGRYLGAGNAYMG